jgi:hypothetical protein
LEEWGWMELLTAKSKVILIKLLYETTVTSSAFVMTQTDKMSVKEERIWENVTTKEVINKTRLIKKKSRPV